MQLVFYWAPKLARKCESKHWFPCGADGRSYGHVITKFSRMGRLPHFLSYGAPSTRALRARVELRYYFSKMTSRLSGNISEFGLVLIVLKSLLETARQCSREKFAILSLKPRGHVTILIHRTWTFLRN